VPHVPRSPWVRARNYYERNIARAWYRHLIPVAPPVPLISFTFDDFPRSALLAGGGILERRGLRGTYYAALGLEGKDDSAGRMFDAADITALLERGHELGSHTFSHSHSWRTETDVYEQDIIRNDEALERMVPGARFESFSYPISDPRPLTKGRAARHFRSCRAGGQVPNAGHTDVNQLASFFLEKSRDNVGAIRAAVDANRDRGGWLIFSTHDVCASPSPFGVTPEVFEEVVDYAVRSGGQILPVARALDVLCRGTAS